jgi:acetyltransferase-like isoleucine patch superfamily enzyme
MVTGPRLEAAVRSFFRGLARPLSYALDLRLIAFAAWFWKLIYWNALRRKFRSMGQGCFIEYPAVVRGGRHISVGDNFHAHPGLRLEAIERHHENTYDPKVFIADNVRILYDCHIGCVSQITIGSNVLIASKVFITDHSHGEIGPEALRVPPPARKLVSKGPVIIEDNVWIGEGVAILPNVRIGRNAIIGANAVVTRDIPENCVVGGVPARIIRRLEG